MKLSFRQGIVRYEQFQSPAILSQTQFGAESVDLNVIEEPIVVTFAHHGSNYIIQETNTVIAAWGAGGPNNEALAPGPTYYLYWEIDQATGALNRGWTTVPWTANSDAPLNPVVGQHWFDTVNTRMRVWKQTGANPGYWQDVIRVFAGVFNGSTVTPYAIGSQAGLTGSFEGGQIILGVNNSPLRQQDGSFVTTTTPLIIQQTSGQNVKFEAALVFGQAIEEIPAFYLASLSPDKRIKLALSGDVANYAFGLTLESLSEGEVGQLVTSGIVSSDQWNWPDDSVGKPLFLGPTGQLWLTPPPSGITQRVGEVYSSDSVNLNFHQPIRRDADPALITAGKVLVLQTDGVLAEAALPSGGGSDTDDQTAAEVTITAIPELPGATTVQAALEELASATTSVPANTCFGYSHQQTVPDMVWTINHGGNTTNAAVTIYDEDMNQVIPDEVNIVSANVIDVYFNTAEVGSAVIIMFAQTP